MIQYPSPPSWRSRKVCCVAISILLVVLTATAPVMAQDGTGTSMCSSGPPIRGESGETTTADSEIVFVNDDSGSMSAEVEPGVTRLDLLKDAVATFIQNTESTDELGHVRMHDAALVQELTTDHAAVNQTVQDLTTNPNEQLEGDALDNAKDELLNGTEATENATKVIIFVTDGEPNQPTAAREAAENAREAGIVIFSIGIGGSVDDQFMIDIAGDESRYYESPNSEDLEQIYADVQQDVAELESNLIVETRDLYLPGDTRKYRVYEQLVDENNNTVRKNVTGEATVTTTNSTLLSVDESSHTLTATSDSNTSNWVRVDANYNGTSGCTNVIIAEPTVKNLELLPGIWRITTVISDPTIFFLLIGTFSGVAATRFSSAFAGIAIGQMVMTVGWFAGYVTWAIAAVSLFAAMFIGLNLALNTEFAGRGHR